MTRKPTQNSHLLSARWLILLVLLVNFSGSSRLHAQQNPTETIKVETTDVIVDVIVTDKNGRHVPGLTAQDFAVTEDGVAQKIVSFAESRAKDSTATATAPEPPAAPQPSNSPAAPVTAQARPHLLTVVMDLADSRPDNLRKSADAVVKYLEKKLTPDDYVAIYYIDRTLRLGLPFTNNLEHARAALASLGSTTTAVPASASDRRLVQTQIDELFARAHPESQLGMAGEVLPSRDNPQVLLLQRELNTLRTYLVTQNTLQAKAVFTALRAICLSYRDLPGRKNVVLFTEGFLYADDARPQMEAVADAANRANVALYVIDPVGLESGRGGAPASINDTLTSQIMDIASQGPPAVGDSHVYDKFDTMRSLGDTRNQQLQWLADITGGLMVKNQN